MLQTLQIYFLQLFSRFRRDEEGATMVEYGIMVALIAVVCFAAVQLLGNTINALFTAINTSLTPLL
jgi:pilus assembly protein Flp/PilA